MNHIIVASFLCLLLTNVHSWDINSYSTFSFDENSNALGVESSVKNFISLANDPKSSLPDSFTICSSILLMFINGGAHFVQMYTEDGSHWFNFQLGSFPNSLDVQTRILYMDPSTGAFQTELFSDVPIPMIPHSWYHVCLGLDTVSGHLRIVINGVKVVDMEKQYFKNSTTMKPKSLIGKVTGKILVLKKLKNRNRLDASYKNTHSHSLYHNLYFLHSSNHTLFQFYTFPIYNTLPI